MRRILYQILFNIELPIYHIWKYLLNTYKKRCRIQEKNMNYLNINIKTVITG